MHALFSISIHVPIGATNGLFITLLDEVLRNIQKQLEKCQTTRFPILELLLIPKRKPQVNVGLTKLLCCKSTQLTVQLSHQKKLLNRSVVDYSPRFSKYVQLLLSLRPRYIFLWELFSNDDILWYLIHVFTQEVASDSTQITVVFG
jgi:hypothetical protein